MDRPASHLTTALASVYAPLLAPLLVPLLVLVLSVAHADAVTFTYTASADTFIRGGSPNANDGTDTILRVRPNGPTRSLVQVDQATLLADLDGVVVNSATLTLFVESATNWSTGRDIGIHRVTTDWVETEATWNIPKTGGPAWDGGAYDALATDTYTQTNDLTGFISLDVTADVAAFLADEESNFGWLLRKTDESENGGVIYTSREGVTATNRPMLEIDVDFIACPRTPWTFCKQSTKENRPLLLLKDKDDKDQLIYKWVAGEETTLADLGDPLTTTTYTVCVWDAIADSPELIYEAILPPGGVCDGKPCWKAVKKGFNYKDTDLGVRGMKILILRVGAEGKAKIIAKGQGPGLDLPALPLAQDSTVLAQVKTDHDGGQCYESRFSAPTKRNDIEQFKDKGDAPLP